MKQKHLKYIRIAAAAVMFALFVAVGIGVRQVDALLVTQFGPGLMRLTSGLFLGTLAAALLIAVVTLLFGRVYCSVLCPLGILQDGVAFLAHWNWGKWCLSRYRFMDTRPVKYGAFLFVMVLTVAGVTLPLAALLPSSNFFTAVSNVFLRLISSFDPETGAPVGRFSVNPPAAAFFFSLAVFLVVAALAAWRGRVYCNTLCPVGAALSLLGRNPLYRIVLSQEMCVSCGMCEAVCKGGAIDSKRKGVLTENCVMCFNCIPACKRGGVTLARRPTLPERIREMKARIHAESMFPRAGAVKPSPEPPSFDISRRHFIGAAGGLAAGFGAYLLVRKIEKAMPSPPPEAPKPAMPPGAGNAKRFHEKCVGCGVCIRECEGRVLVPSVTQYGLAGFMQPVVDYSRGSCLYECNRCSNVCPAGALLPLALEVKRLTRIGTASVNADVCEKCGACAEQCPAHAIELVDGFPNVSADHCIGCGVCQNVCPVNKKRKAALAIVVSGCEEQIRVKPPEDKPSAPAKRKRLAVPIPELCLGCGLCAGECPFSAIEMVDGLPKVNANACVGCGHCSKVCPAPDGPAIVVSDCDEQTGVKRTEEKPAEPSEERTGENPAGTPDDMPSTPAKMIAVVNTAECFGCGLCAEECPLSAIEMVDGLPNVNADVCVGCGLCAGNCPAEAIEIRGGEG